MDRIELIPVANEPLAAVREAAGELRDTSIEKVRDDMESKAKDEAEEAINECAVETSAFSYPEPVLARERYEFDYVPPVANLLELVPVRDEEEKQVVLRPIGYYHEGMTPFDAFHAATAETRGMDARSSERDHDGMEVERAPLKPTERSNGHVRRLRSSTSYSNVWTRRDRSPANPTRYLAGEAYETSESGYRLSRCSILFKSINGRNTVFTMLEST